MSIGEYSNALVDKFINVIEDVGTDEYEVRKKAKNCALISIEEQLEVCILGDMTKLLEMQYFIKNQM